MAAKTSKSRGRYKTYGFNGQDPTVKEVLRVIRQSNHSLTYLCDKSGVVPSTVRNWESQKTKRPQHATMQALLKAAGFEFTITRR